MGFAKGAREVAGYDIENPSLEALKPISFNNAEIKLKSTLGRRLSFKSFWEDQK